MGKLSGAVGTYASVPPAVERRVMDSLGLRAEEISTQVVPRDRHAEVCGAIALAGAGLERFATEIRNLQRTEVREVEEPFGAGQKGSSAMPHKRNPILTERLCGLARVLRGYAQAANENVALWHERDISHSGAERMVLPDATILLDYMQHLAARVAREMTVHAERMRDNLELTHGALYSQRALTALVESGMQRDDAYRIVQEPAQRAWDEGTSFRRASLAEQERPRTGTPTRLLARRAVSAGRLRWTPTLPGAGRDVPEAVRAARVTLAPCPRPLDRPQRCASGRRARRRSAGSALARRQGDVASHHRARAARWPGAAPHAAGSSRARPASRAARMRAPMHRRVPPPNGIQL